MENASKALIIAGAILLAILLISLGIMVFNQASNTVSNSGMTDAEKTAFNQKFLKYEGKQTGNMVKALLQEVMASNAVEENIDRQITINTVTPNETEHIPAPAQSRTEIKSNKYYTVTINTYTNGLIKDIGII